MFHTLERDDHRISEPSTVWQACVLNTQRVKLAWIWRFFVQSDSAIYWNEGWLPVQIRCLQSNHMKVSAKMMGKFFTLPNHPHFAGGASHAIYVKDFDNLQ